MSRHRTRPAGFRPRRRVLVALLVSAALLVVAVVGAVVLTSGHSGDTSAAGATPPAGGPATGAATRWWSVPGAADGSRIDADHPAALAASLRASRAGYCTVLRQTVQAGRSILPNAKAGDPALRISAQAFISEITALAPSSVHADWQTLGGAVLRLVDSTGSLPSTSPSAAAAISQAADAIGADARTACGVDVAARATRHA